MTGTDAKPKLNIAIILSGTFLVPLSAFFLGKLSTRKLFILALVVFMAGSVLCAVAPMILVVCAYTLLAVSMQVVVTLLKTWGLNSLDNSTVPHGTPIQNTFVSVSGSLGTAMVVSIGALAGSPFMQVHLGFVCMAVFAVAYFVLMAVFVKE
ncbi:MAG: hypothetical protein MJ161_05285 [Clostridia bacterium]|nr:hypothetical protein [Clostridia bacterium]